MAVLMYRQRGVAVFRAQSPAWGWGVGWNRFRTLTGTRIVGAGAITGPIAWSIVWRKP
jgi:hypothetical protein